MAFVSAASTHFIAVDSGTFRSLSLSTQRALVVESELGVRVGDQLVFREWVYGGERRNGVWTFTGGWVCRQCQHILPGGEGTGVASSSVVLSLNNASENEWATARLKRRLSLAERNGLSPERFWAFEDAQERERREVCRRTGRRPAEPAP